MRRVISVSLPEDLRKELEQFTAEEGMSRSEIIQASLRDYMFLRRFRSLRGRMMLHAQQEGLFTDQDVFDRVS
ncbi:MAG: ribbon-helix-helix protein, CopG family [Planctomycetes bacterium]|nr:ribbon-helix-helix protein, CopG family [Planctomycetota bacterium]